MLNKFEKIYLDIINLSKKAVKKPVSKRTVIKESKFHFVDYSKLAADEWFKKVKENKKVIPLILLKNKSNVEGIAKVYNTIKYMDENMDETECEMSTNEWWEKLGIFVDPYLLQDTTGMPEFDDNNWWDRADDYSYQAKEYIENSILPEYTNEQMKQFAEITNYLYDKDDLDTNSVNKKVSKRRVIKEHKVRRPSRRLIKEGRIDEFEYYDLCLKHAEEIANRFINDPLISKVYKDVLKEEVIKQFKDYERDYDCIHDLDGIAAMICEERYYLIGLEPKLKQFLTSRPGRKFDEKYWIEKYCAEVEGQEGDWYGYLEGDGGFYNNLEPFYKSIADEIYEEYKDIDWTNLSPKYDDGETDSLYESKKVNIKKKVIKESAKRSIKHVKRIKK